MEIINLNEKINNDNNKIIQDYKKQNENINKTNIDLKNKLIKKINIIKIIQKKKLK